MGTHTLVLRIFAVGVCQPQIVIVVVLPQNEGDRFLSTLDVETRDSLEPFPRWTHLHGKEWVTGGQCGMVKGSNSTRNYLHDIRAHSSVVSG